MLSAVDDSAGASAFAARGEEAKPHEERRETTGVAHGAQGTAAAAANDCGALSCGPSGRPRTRGRAGSDAALPRGTSCGSDGDTARATRARGGHSSAGRATGGPG